MAIAAVACGSGSPSAPSAPSFDPLRPFGLVVLAQRVTLSSNQFDIAWNGRTPAYRVVIGTTAGGSEVGTFDVDATTYTFVAPRTANTYYIRVIGTNGTQASEPSFEQLVLAAIDLRHVIDALYFNGGPLSESRAVQPATVQAAVWPDGTHLRVLVSREAGETVRGFAQTAIDDHASLVGGAVTGTTEIVEDDMHSLANAGLPRFTIAVRILRSACPSNALAVPRSDRRRSGGTRRSSASTGPPGVRARAR